MSNTIADEKIGLNSILSYNSVTPEFEEAARNSFEYFKEIEQHNVARDDERGTKNKEFRNKYGFFPEECYDLDRSIACFVLPRLIYFRDHQHGFPYIMGETEGENIWGKILNEMIAGFAILAQKNASELDPDERVTAKKALELFARYYGNLWD